LANPLFVSRGISRPGSVGVPAACSAAKPFQPLAGGTPSLSVKTVARNLQQNRHGQKIHCFEDVAGRSRTGGDEQPAVNAAETGALSCAASRASFQSPADKALSLPTSVLEVVEVV
jgi:hypothetical protein